MLPRIPRFYSLRSPGNSAHGRPCWLQAVPGSKGLFIASQAKRPDERGFPLVQSMLVEVSKTGEIRAYKSATVIARLKACKSGDGRQRAIEWIDGSGVSWVERIRA